MLERLLNSRTSLTAEGALNGLSARQSALANNIANANTPGFKRQRVDFESELASAIESNIAECTGSVLGQPEPFRPMASRDEDSEARIDGNNVTLEREMVQLADTALKYQTMSQYVSGYYSGLKNVINQSR